MTLRIKGVRHLQLTGAPDAVSSCQDPAFVNQDTATHRRTYRDYIDRGRHGKLHVGHQFCRSFVGSQSVNELTLRSCFSCRKPSMSTTLCI